MDQANLKKIYDEYRSLVWSMIWKMGIRGHEQEDIFMESWKAIFQSLESFAGRAKLSTWIARIARNKSMDHIRDRRLIPLEESELNRVIDGTAPEVIQYPSAPRSGQDPGDKAIQREEAGIVRAAVEDLSPEMKFIVKKWMIGLKYSEIAELLNAVSDTPVDTNYVGKQIFHAKARLRKTLAGKGIMNP